MRRLVYALGLTGQATPAGPDGGLLSVTATASRSTLSAIVGPTGLAATLEPAAGGEVAFAAELTLTGAASLQAIGTIIFGDGNLVRIATVGSGYLGPGPTGRHGGAVWRVEGGEGQFAGARGLITSNFMFGENLEIADHHLGVLYLP
jgi:hypothetical protein